MKKIFTHAEVDAIIDKLNPPNFYVRYYEEKQKEMADEEKCKFFYLSIDLTYRIIYIELNEGSSLIDKNEDQTMDHYQNQ